MSLNLIPRICQEQDCDTIIFSESTGAYSATNTSGWNDASTAMISDITEAWLYITLPDDTELERVDLTPQFPTTNADLEFEITTEDVGLEGSWPSGVYTFRYLCVAEDGSEYERSCYVFLACSEKCCVKKLYSKVTTTDCADCKNSKLMFAVEADGFLTSAEYSAMCGNITNANALLAKVQYMCNLVRCNC